jgi:hypothetical protein
MVSARHCTFPLNSAGTAAQSFLPMPADGLDYSWELDSFGCSGVANGMTVRKYGYQRSPRFGYSIKLGGFDGTLDGPSVQIRWDGANVWADKPDGSTVKIA